MTYTKHFVHNRRVNKKRAALPKPTPSELAILGVLWRIGPATVRQVHEALGRGHAASYTTTLKLMQIMTGKGLLERDERGRAHLYRPVSKREETQGRIVSDLLDRAFGGSAAELVLRALSERRASAEEIREIRATLDSIERERKR